MRQPQRARLLRLLDTQSQSGNTRRMRGVMREMLEDAGMEVRTVNQQLFARKGSAEHVPFIVAHADTVHKIQPRDKYRISYDMKNGEVIHHAYDPTTNRSRGVGGDDKCGLWLAQEMARNLENCAVVITVDEEIGCVGARRVTPAQLQDATVLIQGDRRGNDDAVVRANGINIASEEWQDHVRSNIRDHGYRYCTYGSSTDVAAMHDTKSALVSAVNLSAGYHAPHTDAEYVRESELENAYELAMKLAERSMSQRWEHTAARHVYTHSSAHGNEYVTPFFADWFGNTAYALQKGFHATHLVRDVSRNRPTLPKWKYNQQERRTESADGKYVCVFLLGGVLIYTVDDLMDVHRRIVESGNAPKLATWQSDAPQLIVNRYLSGYLEHSMQSDGGPICGLVDGCNEPAKVFHSFILRWGCDTHIEQAMKERGEEYLSPRPASDMSITQIRMLDDWPLDDGEYNWYHGY